MKTCFYLLFIIFLIAGCSGSDIYQGTWKATDTEGRKLEIVFTPELFSIKDSTGKISQIKYSQYSIKIENATKIYGIKTSDGRSYNIIFADADAPDKGLITHKNYDPVFAISRNNYIRTNSLYW